MIDNDKHSSLLYYITDNKSKKFQNTSNYKLYYKSVKIINKASSSTIYDYSATASLMYYSP